MPVVLNDVEARASAAIVHYWTTLEAQGQRQAAGEADRGRRAAVTGGKQMRGFCELVYKLLAENGFPEVNIYHKDKLELPGYFRPTKNWDMLVVHEGCLLAALEFKSQRGPSFGNNFNNRTEEAIGTAQDLWTAYREQAFGKDKPRPWLGWLMLVEDCPRSQTPVEVQEPHYLVFPEFKKASYAKRYELLLRRLVLERLYDAASLILATEEGARMGTYKEPASDLGIKKFLSGLAGHVASHMASL
jgi:hypothetical protein